MSGAVPDCVACQLARGSRSDTPRHLLHPFAINKPPPRRKKWGKKNRFRVPTSCWNCEKELPVNVPTPEGFCRSCFAPQGGHCGGECPARHFQAAPECSFCGQILSGPRRFLFIGADRYLARELEEHGAALARVLLKTQVVHEQLPANQEAENSCGSQPESSSDLEGVSSADSGDESRIPWKILDGERTDPRS